MTSRIALVWELADQIAAEVCSWVKEKDGIDLYAGFSIENRLRLLKLRTWKLRYRLPVKEILSLVVPVLREHIESGFRKKSKRRGLGIGIPALTGRAAERILISQMKKKYPNNEHLAQWRQLERERQLSQEEQDETDLPTREVPDPTLLNSSSVASYVRRYRVRCLSRREKLEKEQSARWRRRKAYRGNPWR